MKRPWSRCLAVMFSCLYTVLCQTALSEYQQHSFFYEIRNRNPPDEPWRRIDEAVPRGTKTRLTCMADSKSATILKGLDESKTLEPLTYTEDHVYFDFGDISCADTGSYMCQDGENSSRQIDLGVLNCEPRLCSNEAKHPRIKISLDKPISLCLTAYPAVKAVLIADHASDALKTTGTRAVRWHAQTIPKHFGTYTVNITFTDVFALQPGDSNLFSVVVLYNTGARKILDLTLELEYPEPHLLLKYEIQNYPDEKWTGSTMIFKGTKTRLRCLSESPPNTSIRRLGESDSLKPLTREEYQTVYGFGEISCDDMGSYVCELQHGSSRLDLGILGCEPRLCSNEAKHPRMKISLNETISLCLTAYPAVKAVFIADHASDALKTTGTRAVSWHAETIPKQFGTYTVNITFTDVFALQPGEYSNVFSVVVLYYTGARKILDLTLELEYPGHIQRVSQKSQTGAISLVMVAVLVLVPSLIGIAVLIVICRIPGKLKRKVRARLGPQDSLEKKQLVSHLDSSDMY